MFLIMSLLAGVLFGVGLTISQMINPDKIQNFLDITGQWDASLLFVMIGALLATFLGYRIVFRQSAPKCASEFKLPQKKQIDTRLLFGAALFGIGWGLAGYCPGPGLTAIGLGIMDAVYFVFGMVIAAVMLKFVKI